MCHLASLSCPQFPTDSPSPPHLSGILCPPPLRIGVGDPVFCTSRDLCRTLRLDNTLTLRLSLFITLGHFDVLSASDSCTVQATFTTRSLQSEGFEGEGSSVAPLWESCALTTQFDARAFGTVSSMSRLAYGIPTQTGAQAFRREVEQSLASWRDMIDKDDARVVRSIHIPPAPNSIDGPMPVTIYQIAVRATGRISHLSIQGKHNPLPTPISNWYEGQKANARTKSRSRSDSEGKLAAKRRLQAAREAEAEAAQDAAVYGYDDSGFEASGEFEHEEQTDGCKESFLAHKKARFVAGEAAQEAADEIHHHDTSMVTAYDQVPIHVHPPTPRKPSKPSARRPGPPRYSQRTRSASMNPGFAYTPDELRHTIASTLASTAQSDAGDTWSQLGSDVTATSRALRRSSRLASLAPGGLDHNDDGHSMTDATRRLHDVGLVEGDDGEADDDLPDTDMSSMIIDYEDPEEAAMARQQESAEAARRQAELTGQLPCIPDFALPGERTIKLEPDYDGGYEFGPHGQLDTMAAA